MTTHAAPQDNTDSELLALLADLGNLDLGTAEEPPRTPSPPPRTPSPRPPLYIDARHTFPAARLRTHVTPDVAPTVYHYESPTRRGYTTEWSLAGAATQGVPSARVRAVQTGSPRKKPRSKTKKAAYVVFCGRECGVYLTWDETMPLVLRAPNCIFRGFSSVAAAHAAYAYAVARSWTRVTGASSPAHPMARLPRPLAENPRGAINPLNGSEDLDDLWYIVYRGITPGVYRSHLECQLNTLGISGALHESVSGQAAALDKYASATQRGESAALSPRYLSSAEYDTDPFV